MVPAVRFIFILYLTLTFVVAVPAKEELERAKTVTGRRYSPEWSDLDSRPLPQWYDAAKVGVFMHWGVYSVPAFTNEWFWEYWYRGDKDIKQYMAKNYPPNFTYQDFASQFTAEFFDPEEWAQLFADAGMKYVVLTTKHHEGYTLFPSRRSFSWNSVDVGPKRDLVGDLAKALTKNNLKFGAYYSLFEWFNPVFLDDMKAGTQIYPDYKTWPDMRQLVNDYKPSLIWADGVHFKPDTYWNSTYFLSWLYNDSPIKDEVVVNDRWGYKTDCLHGDFYNCGDEFKSSTLFPHKWEYVFRLYQKGWAFKRNMKAKDVLSVQELLNRIVKTVSCGGNALIDFGPTKEGTIPAIFEERLRSLGKWLKVNGEAIYGTSPWFYQNDTINGDVWYTCTKTPYDADHPTHVPKATDSITAIYATFLKWPLNFKLELQAIASFMPLEWRRVQMLGVEEPLKYTITNDVVEIELPQWHLTKSEYAWSLKFTH